MAFYLLKRLLLALFTLLIILFLSYLLLRLAPGDPTRSSFLSAENGGMSNADKAELARNEALRAKLKLDEPILKGFGEWLDGVIRHGDFGSSATVEPGRPVAAMILERLPVTVKLNLLAIFLTYLLAIPIGVFSAVRPDRGLDRISTLTMFLLYSLPVMWAGLMLQALFCAGGKWPLFPLKGLAPYDGRLSTFGALGQSLFYYSLPVVCLAYAGLAGLARYTRTSMIDVLQQDYIRTARAKGLGPGAVIWGHAFRNSLITLITLFSGLLPGLVAGSIIVEHIFNIPGMGTLSLLALSSRDYPLQMALFAFAGMLTLLGILLADLCYTWADPRIKLH